MDAQQGESVVGRAALTTISARRAGCRGIGRVVVGLLMAIWHVV